MTVLYVREEGAVVGHVHEQVQTTVLDKKSGKKRMIGSMPVREIEQVVVYGNVQVTTQAMRLLMRHEIDVIMLTQTGRHVCTISRQGSKFAQLRHQQLRLASDVPRSIQIAIRLVQAKTANQRNLLNQLAEQLPAPMAGMLSRGARGIDQMRREVVKAGSPDQVRGYEGKASAFYFEALKGLFGEEWSFQGRNYYPPLDPFNAMLSFGYALLAKDMETTIQRVGLDPYIGCLHAMEVGRPSLVLDLMEEFRPLVVDRAMLDLVLGKQVKPTDFTFTQRKERPVEIGTRLMPTIIQAYETRVQDLVPHGESQSQNKLRRCFELQARIYGRVIMGERADYEGFVP